MDTADFRIYCCDGLRVDHALAFALRQGRGASELSLRHYFFERQMPSYQWGSKESNRVGNAK